MNLLSVLLKSLLSDGALSALAKKTGIGSAALKKLLPLAVPLLLKAMTNNVSSQSGAQSLLGALTQHTSKKSLPEQIAEADQADGCKILGHIFGGNASAEIGALASQTGLSSAQVSSALSGIAPALLSGLSAATASGGSGKVDLSDGLDLSDLMAMFGGASQGGTSGLLGALTGGQNAAPSLGSLLGGGQSSAPSVGGLLGSLLGGGMQESDNSLNGNTLMSVLMNAMK